MRYIHKPRLGAQLNRSHPLARGLFGAWIFNEGGGEPVDLVTGESTVSTSDPVWVRDALTYDGAADYTDLLDPPPALTTYTFAILARVHSHTVIYYRIAEHDKFDEGWTIAKGGSTSDEVFRWQQGSINDEDIAIPDKSAWALWVISYDGSQVSGGHYPIGGGVATEIPPFTPGYTTLGTARTVRIAQHAAGVSRFADMDAGGAWYWNRALSSAEIRSMQLAPYQIIHSPYTRQVHQAAPASGLSIPVAINHLRQQGIT